MENRIDWDFYFLRASGLLGRIEQLLECGYLDLDRLEDALIQLEEESRKNGPYEVS